jgi:putative flavoprotein involved in K+ transport
MERIETVIIGGGQAGLAMSRSLTDLGRDHVVLERGRVAQRWSDRWDSLKLLTPNWMTRLPGYSYNGAKPDGFMTKDEVAMFLRTYGQSFDAPVLENTSVESVASRGASWRVGMSRGNWKADNVIVATGHCDKPFVPEISNQAPSHLHQIDSVEYRNPGQLPEGGVLVVGASATGVQLAEELRRSGRDVIISAGRHIRIPRVYRGRDTLYWLDRMGSLDRPRSDVDGDDESVHEPSLQLVGRENGESIDLESLRQQGVRLAGRLTGFDVNRAHFAADLALNSAKAEVHLFQILGRIDRFISSNGMAEVVPAAESISRIQIGRTPRDIDLQAAGVRTVLWATGYRRSYPWLHAPVLNHRGEIRQYRGRTPATGLYVLGLEFMITRRSSQIDGVGRDAIEIANHISMQRPELREAVA